MIGSAQKTPMDRRGHASAYQHHAVGYRLARREAVLTVQLEQLEARGALLC
jgi:hypothetical protein